MRLIGRDIIDRARRAHADAGGRLRSWVALVEQGQWLTPVDVRSRLGSADFVAGKVVFDIGGNRYRLIARIDYANGIVRVLWFGTHAEYDRIDVEEL